MTYIPKRRLPVGAEVLDGGGVHFRVWAPRTESVEVVLDDGAPSVSLEREPSGYFSGVIESAGPGTAYYYRLNGTGSYPDPASRFQPGGPHGASQVVDPGTFPWSDAAWGGVSLAGQVIYEMHIGTFTQEGTWAAATEELEELSANGISVLELMPVAEFPGRFGWGYDGVDLFAPTRLYGGPDDFRRFVDRAHACRLGVILDVVYNHFGPEANYIEQFSRSYFTEQDTEWGRAINFDGADSGPVREFFLANAGYWIREFHLDGLRLDATQQIFDTSPDHILAAIVREVRAAAGGKASIVVAENEPQVVKLVHSPVRGGYGIDGLWNDDFHHSAMVAMTGRREAYYTDYLGTPQEFISAAKRGYLYQGQHYKWQKQRRGTPATGVAPECFVSFIQNHDQVANSARGERIHQLTSPGRLRAMTALTLLMPGTPMLFQGQEFAASSPFLYFADHRSDLTQKVLQGRREFLSQFPSLATAAVQELLTDPADPITFARSKLDLSERAGHAWAYAMHGDLLKLRRGDPVLRAPRPGAVDGAVLGDRSFVLRYLGDEEDRLLFVNLGADLELLPAPEPMLAPRESMGWEILWSSEDPLYGGNGTAPVESEGRWRIPGEAAVLLKSVPEKPTAKN